MKSGLEDRNNSDQPVHQQPHNREVSMKSGLEDRNNLKGIWDGIAGFWRSQ